MVVEGKKVKSNREGFLSSFMAFFNILPACCINCVEIETHAVREIATNKIISLLRILLKMVYLVGKVEVSVKLVKHSAGAGNVWNVEF